jgi:LruC domain-containing protein
LTVIKRTDSSALNLNIFDLAFHPDNGNAYSVDSGGNLHLIDVATGSSSNLGNVGERGTFGAVYFDVEGTFYISRNNDGNVFRIDVSSSTPQAELFAIGPSSSNNDGARCATAPLINEDDETVDYGDAPDSYGTSLASNGARHEIVEDGLFLGKTIDGEPLAAVFPNSDEGTNLNDEDGIAFLNGFEPGFNSVIQIEASKSGFVSAWLDSNLDGVFSANEQVITDLSVDAGITRTAFEVPSSAQTGTTWIRFRISDINGLQATGGVLDGEVEDYNVLITEGNYSARTEQYTVAFEDNWPNQGDYDINDVVVYLSLTEWSDEVSVRRLKINGVIKAVGASYQNGFALRLKNIDPQSVRSSSFVFSQNGEQSSDTPIEANRSELILIATQNVWSMVETPNNCDFFNTQSNCLGGTYGNFSIELEVEQDQSNSDFSLQDIDPFIFATPGTYHGATLGTPGRSWEVHLKNVAPTEAFDSSLLGSGDDFSNPASDLYFQSANGMPWAFKMSSAWSHPTEFTDLMEAYPMFESFVVTEGAEGKQWFLPQNAVSNKIVE